MFHYLREFLFGIPHSAGTITSSKIFKKIGLENKKNDSSDVLAFLSRKQVIFATRRTKELENPQSFSSEIGNLFDAINR